MVSALDSESSGPGSSPGRGTALCSDFSLLTRFKISFQMSLVVHMVKVYISQCKQVKRRHFQR